MRLHDNLLENVKNNEGMKGSKGQFFSVDAIFASIIFILIILSVQSYWDYSMEKINYAGSREELEASSRNAINLLLLSGGVPSNWTEINSSSFNQSSVQSIGLINSDQLILDSSKIDKFLQINTTNYNALKNIMGIPEKYEFEIKFYRWNETDYVLYAYAGSALLDNATDVVNINRYAVLNNTWMRISFRGWEAQ